ncbi:hypothetical protein ACFX10_027190 [Malus domestica]
MYVCISISSKPLKRRPSRPKWQPPSPIRGQVQCLLRFQLQIKTAPPKKQGFKLYERRSTNLKSRVFPTPSRDSLTEPTRIPVTHPQPGDAVERPVRQVGVFTVTGKFFVGGGQGDCGERILLAPVAEGYDDSERPRVAASASVSGHFAESFWVVFLIK